MTTAKVTLIVDSSDIQGNPFTYGAMHFVPSMRIPDPDGEVLLEVAEAIARFGGSGIPQIDLYPNDLLGPGQSDGTPGWVYTVEYHECPGNPSSWSFYLLSTNGTPQRLSSLAETPVAQPGSIAADKNHTEDFAPARSVTITHNLGKKPSVTVIDSAGDRVDCGVSYPSLNVVTLQFSAVMGGTVTCN